MLRAVLAERPGIRLPRSVAGAARGAASSQGSWDHPGLHRQQALALHFLARELAGAADSFRLLPRFLFRGFLVMTAEPVVVPSPAWSEVFEATSRTICAPMFATLSSSSISLATVTPSLVMRGAPNDLSSTTLRPLGPRVTRTALARMSMPCSILSRASTENLTSLADILIFL